MRSSRVLRLAAFGLVAATSLAACRRRVDPSLIPGATDPGPAAAGTSSSTATPPTAVASADTLAIADTLGSGANDAAGRSEAEMRNALLAAVYFDFDQSDLTDQTRAALEQKAAMLRQNERVTLRIAGHTDTRGSDEYNLALGQRRAAVVKRYLVERGIAGSRLDIVSFGEERPAAQGEDEGAYSQNRRAEFEITGGSPAR